MSKKNLNIKVNALAFHRAVLALTELEQQNGKFKINGKPISQFLLMASDYETSGSSIPNEVKKEILILKGSSSDPASLSNEKEMSDFEFRDMHFLSLTGKFNEIIKKHNSSASEVSVMAVMGCELVKDCVDLVTTAAS